MQRIKSYFQKIRDNKAKKNEKNAKVTVLEELFHDLYNDRKRIYKVNFFRGIFFGLGSALGGTVVIALALWTLSLFENTPLVGELFENAQSSIERTTEKATD